MNALKGVVSAILLLLNTVVMVPILLLFAVLKLLLPIKSIRTRLSQILVWIAELWIAINASCYRLVHGNKTEILELPQLAKDEWYLVVSNHQSTADIPVLQAVFNKRIPFLKFFIKQELIWVPLLGLAWWALDFPFMKRYSKSQLKLKPQLQGKDFEKTQKSCEKFKSFPTSVINFVEGTRFTQSKKNSQKSPYQHLLKPKAGGIGYVMGSMGKQMQQMLLVSLVYQGNVPGFWDYLCGKYDKVLVSCKKIVIPDTLLNKNYQTDEKFKTELYNWCQNLWYKQDNLLEGIYERTNI